MRKMYIYVLIALAIIGIGIFIFSISRPTNDILNTSTSQQAAVGAVLATSTVSIATSTNSSAISTSTSYSMTEVEKHNTKTSCWTTIRGNVYDVTSWISKHPGGQVAILSLCGKDGSAAFETKHGDAQRPNNELAGFEIGVLIK